jgi:hypothetical protein
MFVGIVNGVYNGSYFHFSMSKDRQKKYVWEL